MLLASLVQMKSDDLAISELGSSGELNALSLKLGQMQAEILRLNALGERLVEKAGLSPEEFDFQYTPPQGGPEPHETLPSSADEFALEMARLSGQLLDRGRKLRLLDQLTMERELGEGSLVPGLPVRSGYVSSYFGARKDPIHGGSSFHSGIDYAGKMGSDILAVADGLVIFSESASGYGRTVEIRHANGLVTRYAHCKKLLVEVGDLVTKGQVIATLGNSGRSTGPHLHFEVLRDGVAMNPLRLAGLDLPK
ncbi:MAG: M23 family metallopeptidase [Chromatiaceae bacterium]